MFGPFVSVKPVRVGGGKSRFARKANESRCELFHLALESFTLFRFGFPSRVSSNVDVERWFRWNGASIEAFFFGASAQRRWT
jgi:hypothetical protein